MGDKNDRGSAYDSAELDELVDVKFAAPDGEKFVPSLIDTGSFSI